MNKDLQNKAWASLSKEFKEEVKELWEHENKVLMQIDCVTTLNEIFGKHNLTSDADGDELTDTINWEQRRYELAKELMKGFASNPHQDVVGQSIDTLVAWSVGGADELIKRLQDRNK